MTLAAKKTELLAQLSGIRDAQERFAYVVECGRRCAPLEGTFKTDEFRVEGCLAHLWLVSAYQDGKCLFHADSDSVMMKGIAVIVCDFYSDQTPEEILLADDPSFLGQVGITQHLTPNRRNGLARMWEKIRDFAAQQPGGTLPVAHDS